MNLRQAYASLMALYPRDHRLVFAEEMKSAFHEAAAERMRQGMTTFAWFLIWELRGLLRGVCREWFAKLAYSLRHSNSYITGRGAPNRLLMRPAGVSWEAFYGGQVVRTRFIGPRSERAIPEQAGGKPNRSLRSQECLNARQKFESGSSLRRLILFPLGDSCRCRCGVGWNADRTDWAD